MPTSYLFASDQLLEPMNRQVLGHLQDIGTRQAASTERMGEAILQGYTAIADVRMKQEAFAQRAQAMQMENQLAAQNMQLRAQELDLRRQEHEFGKQTQQSDELERALLNIAGKKRMIQKNGQWMHQTVLNGKIHLTEATEDEISDYRREKDARMSDLESRTEENKAQAEYYRARSKAGAPSVRDLTEVAEMLLKQGIEVEPQAAFDTARKVLAGKQEGPAVIPPPAGTESRPSAASQPSTPAPKKLVTGTVEEPKVKLPPPTKKREEGGAMASYDPEFFTSAMDKFTEWALADKDGAFTKMRMKERAKSMAISDGEPWFASKGERSQFVRALFIKEASEVEDAFIRYKAQTAGVPVDIARTLWRNTVNDAIGRGDAKSLEPIRKEFEQSLKARLAYKGFNLGETKK